MLQVQHIIKYLKWSSSGTTFGNIFGPFGQLCQLHTLFHYNTGPFLVSSSHLSCWLIRRNAFQYGNTDVVETALKKYLEILEAKIQYVFQGIRSFWNSDFGDLIDD